MCNHKTTPLIGGSKVYLLSIIDEVFAFGLKLYLNIIEVNREIQERICVKSIKHASSTAAHNQALLRLTIVRSTLTASTN